MEVPFPLQVSFESQVYCALQAMSTFLGLESISVGRGEILEAIVGAKPRKATDIPLG